MTPLSAARPGLTGHVRNTTGGVAIDVDGREDALEAFVRRIEQSPPPALPKKGSDTCTSTPSFRR
jgi:hydrogenase maturation factor HypF (carbamoyltransferase family)